MISSHIQIRLCSVGYCVEESTGKLNPIPTELQVSSLVSHDSMYHYVHLATASKLQGNNFDWAVTLETHRSCLVTDNGTETSRSSNKSSPLKTLSQVSPGFNTT